MHIRISCSSLPLHYACTTDHYQHPINIPNFLQKGDMHNSLGCVPAHRSKDTRIKMYEDGKPKTIETRCSYGSMQARQG